MKAAAALLLILVVSNTLTPMLTPFAENASKSESLWEKAEDKMIQYAYSMAERRKFIDYLFIPGFGGGKQQMIGTTDGVYVLMLLLPSIPRKDSPSTTELFQKIISSSFGAIFSAIREGEGIEGFSKRFYDQLNKNAEFFGENVVSFYLPYQRMMFRVVAIIWIQSSSLIQTMAKSLVEATMGASFHFMKALIDEKIDDLIEKVKDRIENKIIQLKEDVVQFITASSLEKPAEGRGMYTIIGIASITSMGDWIYLARKKIEEVIKLETYFKSALDIVNYNEATEGMKNPEGRDNMYEKLFATLKTAFDGLIKLDELCDMLQCCQSKQSELGSFNKTKYSASEWNRMMDAAEEDAKNKLKNEIYSKLNEINKTVNEKIDDFLNEIKSELKSTLDPLFNEANKLAGELASEFAGSCIENALKMHPLAAAIYTVANTIHQVFARTITQFKYTVTLPEKSLVKTNEGYIDYSSPTEKVSDIVPNQGWWQGCIQGIMAGIAGAIDSKLGEAINYIPQIFLFDIDFKDKKVITGGMPGIYLLNGSIKFENIYSNMQDFLNNIGSTLCKSKNDEKDRYSLRNSRGNPRYSIFTDTIANEISKGEEKKSDTEVKFIVPFIIASAFPVVRNIMEIKEDSLKVKMSAIFDLGSFVAPVIKAGEEKLEEKVKGCVEEIIRIIEETLNETTEMVIKEIFEGEEGEETNPLKIVLKVIGKEVAESISKEIIEEVFNKINEKWLSEIFEKVFEEIDVAGEKLTNIISITMSLLSIPVRGIGGKISIIIPSIGVIIPIDNLGYCELEVNKMDLIEFSAPIYGMRSYAAFSDEGSIGMIPYSTYSYEPLVIQIFAEISLWPNVFKAKQVINPRKEVTGILIKPTEELGSGVKLIMLRDSSQAKSIELMYIPNPYPYAEAYVKIEHR